MNYVDMFVLWVSEYKCSHYFSNIAHVKTGDGANNEIIQRVYLSDIILIFRANL